MQWQYKRIVVFYTSGYEQIQHILSNDIQLANITEPAIFFDYLNRHGKDGWELVNGFTQFTNSLPVETYFLKRVIAIE